MAYKIESQTFDGALAQLVAAFKDQNPGITSFGCELSDGTTVRIQISAPRRKKTPARA